MLNNSYRPISLLPCIPKLLKKMFPKSLNYHLESNHKLSPTQNDFRKRLSTVDQLAKLEITITTTYVEKNICFVLFIDLSEAYNTIWHTGLAFKMEQTGIKGKLLNWVNEHLS